MRPLADEPDRPLAARRAHPSLTLAAIAALGLAGGFGGCSAAALAEVPAPIAPATPAGAVPARVIELAREKNRVQEHLEYLCEEIGPRLTGSTGYERAARWTRDQFASFGLDARLEPWGEVPVGFDRGPWWGGLVEPEVAEFDFVTPAWTPGTRGPARGPLVAFPADGAALAAFAEGGAAAGAWVLAPGPRTGASSTGRDREAERAWRVEAEAALEELGALGVIRSSGSELVRASGRWDVDLDEPPRLVQVLLRGDQHADLTARMERGERPVVELSVQNTFRPGPIEQVNVVADLLGREFPDEYVIVCGHLDSWDGASGAIDNGTGVATTLEAARLLALAGARPKRTIRFILWGGEEQGLHGSRAWVEAHRRKLPRVSAVLNHDGGTNYLAGLIVTPEMQPQLAEACAAVFGLDPEMPFELVVRDALPGSASSDHAPFVQAGVPGFFWRQEGRSNYRHFHHTQHDHFEAAIPEYQQHSAQVVALTAFGIAELDERLERRNMEPLEPRRMGVRLDGLTVVSISDGSRARAAGWEPGDVVVAVDGAEVESARALVEVLQDGEPLKRVTIERAGERLDSQLDWSRDPAEQERARRRAERQALEAGH